MSMSVRLNLSLRYACLFPFSSSTISSSATSPLPPRVRFCRSSSELEGGLALPPWNPNHDTRVARPQLGLPLCCTALWCEQYSTVAPHCYANNIAAMRLYKGRGFKCIRVPKQANWSLPKTSPGIQFNFMMKLLSDCGTDCSRLTVRQTA